MPSPAASTTTTAIDGELEAGMQTRSEMLAALGYPPAEVRES